MLLEVVGKSWQIFSADSDDQRLVAILNQIKTG